MRLACWPWLFQARTFWIFLRCGLLVLRARCRRLKVGNRVPRRTLPIYLSVHFCCRMYGLAIVHRFSDGDLARLHSTDDHAVASWLQEVAVKAFAKWNENAQRHRQTDGRTDRRTDNIIMPIANHIHTECIAVRSANNIKKVMHICEVREAEFYYYLYWTLQPCSAHRSRLSIQQLHARTNKRGIPHFKALPPPPQPPVISWYKDATSTCQASNIKAIHRRYLPIQARIVPLDKNSLELVPACLARFRNSVSPVRFKWVKRTPQSTHKVLTLHFNGAQWYIIILLLYYLFCNTVVALHPARLLGILGWMTVCWHVNHLVMYPTA